MSNSNSYVRPDEHGVMRVGGTRVMFDSIVAGFEQGLSAEAIQQQYPATTLEEVYGAIAYYLGHRPTVDEYLRRQDKIWKEWREKCDQHDSTIVQRLRALRHGEAAQSS